MKGNNIFLYRHLPPQGSISQSILKSSYNPRVWSLSRHCSLASIGLGLSQFRLLVRTLWPQVALHSESGLHGPQCPSHGCSSLLIISGGHSSTSRWAFVQNFSLLSLFSVTVQAHSVQLVQEEAFIKMWNTNKKKARCNIQRYGIRLQKTPVCYFGDIGGGIKLLAFFQVAGHIWSWWNKVLAM